MPFEPALTFNIPSICDGTALDCRVYHPASLAANPRSPPWRRHAAIIAHPYAPLGGSYDDPVVEVVASQLLRRGFLVGTFNFRGVGHSGGRTSWTARPEADDYASVAAFLVFYTHHLDPFGAHDGGLAHAPSDGAASQPIPDTPTRLGDRPVLLLGGYSYGSMVASRLPPADQLLATFESPDASSDAAQIRLRAEYLASRQNHILESARSAMLEPRDSNQPSKRDVRTGEGGEGSPRNSGDIKERGSLSLDVEERLRKGVGGIVAKTRPGRHSAKPSDATTPTSPGLDRLPTGGSLPKVTGLTIPRTAYLLVSPPVGLVTRLLTLSWVPSALARARDPQEDAAESMLIRNPTLAVYGDADGFTTVGKIRAWANRLQGNPGSLFQAREIATAGHFWTEEGVLHRMTDAVDEFASSLLPRG